MRHGQYSALLSFVLVATVVAEPQSYGPSASPISFKVVGANTLAAGQLPNILGVAQQPSSITMVDLNDERPYGEEKSRRVWLARYDAVPIATLGNAATTISLSLAFDIVSKDLICAFSDPAPHWAQPQVQINGEIHTGKEGWVSSPAHYTDLDATVSEVLSVVCKQRHIDPGTMGQIVLRPRFTENSRFTYSDGSAVCPPANVWIVEVLGTPLMQRTIKGASRLFTTLVAHVRDKDLKVLPSSMF